MNNTGIINLLKPSGMTSHDAVHYIRKRTNIKRVGHTGTLDPMAVGVLPICIGQATRIIDYLDIDEKQYRCEMILGIETDTQDIWGKVLADRRETVKHFSEERIRDSFRQFIGEIYQTPPIYSAIRVNGRHLYEYARKGEDVNIKPKPVIIKDIRVLKVDSNKGRVTFDVNCSKGTYIRSICHDVGRSLGSGGCMSFLARTASGAFRINDAIIPEEFDEYWRDYLLPIDFPLKRLGKLEVNPDRIGWFLNGGYLKPDEVRLQQKTSVGKISEHIRVRPGIERAYTVYSEGRFLGVVLYDDQKKIYFADKVFGK